MLPDFSSLCQGQTANIKETKQKDIFGVQGKAMWTAAFAYSCGYNFY